MSRSIEALVEPSLLIWARQSAGYEIDEVAIKIKKDFDVVQDWEEGRSKPPLTLLGKLAAMYRRPLATFYLPHPPQEANPPKDFRRLPDSDIQDTPALLFEFRLAQERAAIASELAKELEEKASVRRLNISLSDNAEALGPKLREMLRITMDQQGKWAEPYVALNSWRSAVESLGILVFQTSSVSLDEMRGFSISSDSVPVIVLNSNDHPNGRIFSLLHELGHVLLNHSGVCNPTENIKLRGDAQREETFCNQLAGATLIPRDELLKNPNLVDHGMENWTDDELNALAKLFSVSPEAILRRLLTLAKTSDEFYGKKRSEFLRRYANLTKRKSSGGPKIEVKVVSKLGSPFINLILRAYDREFITSRDLSQYMGMKVDYLSRVEKVLETKRIQQGGWE
jgi:Zn-dependent peptidase ImmA (M78 family)